jgi:glycosyltransferase involved in cell wall biosynthesis
MHSAHPTHVATPGSQRADALPGLTIVLPCLDEAENLAESVRCACAVASRCALEYEVVIVDDGSSDETAELAGEFARADSRVRLIMHARTLGYADALRSGIEAARMPWLLLTDADLQYDIGELADFLPQAAVADLVVGRRMLTQDRLTRRAADTVWTHLLHALLRLPVRDIDCSFRLARRELLAGLQLRAGGPLFGAELLVNSRAAGARIVELPVHHRVRVAGRQTGSGPRLTARTARELMTLRRTALATD